MSFYKKFSTNKDKMRISDTDFEKIMVLLKSENPIISSLIWGGIGAYSFEFKGEQAKDIINILIVPNQARNIDLSRISDIITGNSKLEDIHDLYMFVIDKIFEKYLDDDSLASLELEKLLDFSPYRLGKKRIKMCRKAIVDIVNILENKNKDLFSGKISQFYKESSSIDTKVSDAFKNCRIKHFLSMSSTINEPYFKILGGEFFDDSN